MDEWLRALTLQDYNTRIVVLGVTSLGVAAGIVGAFALLRKRALLGDAISHATLPGIAIAFMLGQSWGIQGKSMPWLLAGATVSGLLGAGAIVLLRRTSRLKEDTALGIILSVFFGAGVALLGITQQMRGAAAAGLESFILGKTASMGAGDAGLIGVVAILSVLACWILRKELTLLCFDDGFAGARGFPVVLLDLILMSLVILISIVGLQAVGLVLMVALLVIPAAAARFWTDRWTKMLVISAVLGGACGYVGATSSAVFPQLPSGPTIVLSCAAVFAISLTFGSRRGVVRRIWNRRKLELAVARQHLLRALYELQEARAEEVVDFDELLAERSWSAFQLRLTIARAEQEGLVSELRTSIQLTRRGMVEAERLTREHRLWELYLITHADVAPARVDRQADRIEHVLDTETVAELRAMLDSTDAPLPPSPHQLSATPKVLDHRSSPA